jgi:hypothetical protein
MPSLLKLVDRFGGMILIHRRKEKSDTKDTKDKVCSGEKK